MKKKVISTWCVMAMFVISIFVDSTIVYARPVVAETYVVENDDREKILSCIEAVIADVECLDYDSSDFETMFIGNAISTYEVLLNEELQQKDFVYYPVFNEEEILFLVLVKEDGFVQMTQGFVDVLSDYEGEDVAIVYDKDESYVLIRDFEEKIVAYEYSQDVEERGDLLESFEIIEETISWTSLERNDTIELEDSIIQPRYDAVMPTVTLLVPKVLQSPYDYICWAASTASIGNYLTGNSYTAVEVARALYGSSFNYTASLEDSTDVLRSKYGVAYNYYSYTTAPSESKIYTNVSAGYPMYGRWQVSTGATHQTVIRGINHASGLIYVMDPLQGYVTASESDWRFSYVGTTGEMFTLIGYASKY